MVYYTGGRFLYIAGYVYIMQIDSFLCLAPWEAADIQVAIGLYKNLCPSRFAGEISFVWSLWMFGSERPLAGVREVSVVTRLAR